MRNCIIICLYTWLTLFSTLIAMAAQGPSSQIKKLYSDIQEQAQVSKQRLAEASATDIKQLNTKVASISEAINRLCKIIPNELLTKFNDILQYYQKLVSLQAGQLETAIQQQLTKINEEQKRITNEIAQATEARNEPLKEALRDGLTWFSTSIRAILDEMLESLEQAILILDKMLKSSEQSKLDKMLKSLEQAKIADFNLYKKQYVIYIDTVIEILSDISKKEPSTQNLITIMINNLDQRKGYLSTVYLTAKPSSSTKEEATKWLNTINTAKKAINGLKNTFEKISLLFIQKSP